MVGHTDTVLVIAFALLVSTSIITPAVGFDATLDRSTHSDAALGERVGSPADVAEGEPLERKQKAAAIVASLNASDERQVRQRDRASALLSGTVDAYRDATRVDRKSVFVNDSKAVKALAAFADAGQDDEVERATELIVSADNETAARAIADAERALRRTEGTVAPPGKRSAAEAHLRNARRAFGQARGILEGEGPGNGNSQAGGNGQSALAGDIKDRAKALQRYKTAWHQAQKALDALDAGTDPAVTIRTRDDPVRNGSGSADRRIVGTVFDVRAFELSAVEVTVGGDRTFSVPLNASTAPASNATFDFTATLDRRVTAVNVTAVDVSTGSEDGGDGTDSRQVGTDVLVLDGDGLPDVYERRVTETDPRDPDSDSGRTDANEADDGVVDGREDFDDDGLRTRIEGILGADPFDPDTDGDGLRDGFEVEFGTDPTDADSDDDGVRDGEADPDGDGLENVREQQLGTDPLVADADGDGVDDGREVDALGTDPLDSDTDDDFLQEGSELRVGTDPLDPDTDDDGTLDGNETYTTGTSDQVAGRSVAVEVTGQGDVAGSVTIEPEAGATFRTEFVSNLSVAPTVDIESPAPIDGANVTIEYDESSIPTNESDLAVFRYNRTLQAFVPLSDTSVDAEANTVTARTDQFSTFTVFTVSNWATRIQAQKPPRAGRGGGDDGETIPVDAAFVLDSSGSMGGNDPQGLRKVGAKRFVGALIEGDRAAVVDFDGSARVTRSLTSDFDAVNASIDAIDARGGTAIADGMFEAIGEFDRNSEDSRAKVAILLSDGRSNAGRQDERAQARRAADRGITIHTIGFGSANAGLLEDVADITGGESHFVSSADELPEVFSRVAENETGAQFSDDDRFPDSLERDGIPVPLTVAPLLEDTTSNGPFPGPDAVVTDPNSADTDRDGLADDEEIGELVSYEVSVPFVGPVKREYYTVNSDPTDTNTDDVGLDDPQEVENGSDPLQAETFVAGYATPVSARPGTDEPATVEDLENCCDAITFPGVGTTEEHLVVEPVRTEAVGGGLFGRDDKLRITVRTTVFAQTNGAGEELLDDANVRARLDIDPTVFNDPEIVRGPESVSIEPGETRNLTHVVVVSPSLGQQVPFRALNDAFKYEFSVENLGGTPFHRSDVDGPDGRFQETIGYAVPGSPLHITTVQLVDRTAIIFSSGISVAAAPTAGLILVRSVHGSLRLAIFELSGGEIGPPLPTSISGTSIAAVATAQGIGAFNDVFVEGEIDEHRLDVDLTVAGPITIRQN